MVAYRDCKGHLVCMADAQTGIVEIHHKDRALRMTVPVGDSFTVTLRDTETVMTRISTRAFHVKSHPHPSKLALTASMSAVWVFSFLRSAVMMRSSMVSLAIMW